MIKLQQAITLIELLFAMAIILIVAAIAIPTYQGYVDEAKIHRTISEIRNIGFVLDGALVDGDLPSNLTELGLELIDPWGNAYEYLQIEGGSIKGKGKLRKDKNLVPLNTDYDLYSKGPDGASQSPLTASASHDDIVRADNGGFIGVAEDY